MRTTNRLDLIDNTRSAQVAAVAISLELLRDEARDEAMVPAHEGIWGGNRGHLFETRATDRMCERREASAFGVHQAEPAATQLGFQDAVFREEIRDDLLLVPLQPAGNHGDQDVEDHNCSSGWRP
jgi:hypothetical protein